MTDWYIKNFERVCRKELGVIGRNGILLLR
jgi:hypothetical protein